MACFNTCAQLGTFIVNATQQAFPTVQPNGKPIDQSTTYVQLGLQHPAVEVFCLGVISMVKSKGCPITLDAATVAAQTTDLKGLINAICTDLKLP
jgi:hypothetical protein